MNVSIKVSAAEFLKETKIPRQTFSDWNTDGVLDSAILFRKKTKSGHRNYYDKNKLVDLIQKNTTYRFAINPGTGLLEANRLIADTKPRKTIEEVLSKEPLEAGGRNLNECRRDKAHYDALTAKLNYEQLIGSLVPVKEVKAVYYNTAKTVRNSLLAIPGRIASELLNKSDAKEIERIIITEMTEVLQGLENVSISQR
jgi:hypothetical protein